MLEEEILRPNVTVIEGGFLEFWEYLNVLLGVIEYEYVAVEHFFVTVDFR